MADAIMRTCRKCGNEKPIDQFGFGNKTKANPVGLRRRSCNDCYVSPAVTWVERQRANLAAGLVPAIEAKVCTGCGENKPTTEFHRNTAHKTGFMPRCKTCIKAYQDANRDAIRAKNLEWHRANRDEVIRRQKQWRQDNPEAFAASKKAHYEKNRDRILAKKKAHRDKPETKAKNSAYMKEWVEKNRDVVRQYDHQRYHVSRKFDPRYLLSKRMQKRMNTSLKGGKSGRSWESLVGYTKQELEAHLRKTMPKGYTWDDFIAGRLHIDHKIPIAAHHFTSADDIDFKRAWDIQNLQLLPASENCAKGAKLAKPFQPSLAGI